MALASGQFTIIDLADIVISATAPTPALLDMVWLDTSLTPAVFKCYNGLSWEAVNDPSALLAYKNQVDSQLATILENTQASAADIVALKEITTSFTAALGEIVASVAESLNGDSLITKINQSAEKILLSAVQEINGIVTKEKNFTFDDDGLSIDDPTKNFRVFIDEDEVTFTRKSDNTVVAQFTAEGANMLNATIIDNLIIGKLTVRKVYTTEDRMWFIFQ